MSYQRKRKKKDHIQITFIIVYCYGCSLLLLLVVIILLCLIYKLKFIKAYIYREKHSIYKFLSIPGFRYSLRGVYLGMHTLWIRSDYCICRILILVWMDLWSTSCPCQVNTTWENFLSVFLIFQMSRW